jgi:biotin carboxylase
VASVGSETLQMLTDKSLTYEKLSDAGLYVPHWKKVNERSELLSVVEDMINVCGDVVVKPANARGGRGVYVISQSFMDGKSDSDFRESHVDLNQFLKLELSNQDSTYPFIVMERLQEPVYDLDILAWDGMPVRLVGRKRINSAVPNDGHVIVDNAELIELGTKLVKLFNLSWLYDCDIMFDLQGRPCVLEINPRQSGSVAVSVAAGFPIFDDLISLYKGESVANSTNGKVGTRIVPYKTLKVMPS